MSYLDFSNAQADDPREQSPSPAKMAMFAQIRREYKGTSCKVQCARLREALSRGSVTTFEAMRHLDIYHPPARIWQLRRNGTSITTHWQTILTEARVKHRVGRYVLNPLAGGGSSDSALEGEGA